MDNVTSLPVSTNPCIIKLDQFQYAFYQQSRVEIHSPEGECLAQIGEELTRIAEEDAIFQLCDQACLLEVLFDQVQDDVKIPQQAFTSLADMMGRINTHLKTQMAKTWKKENQKKQRRLLSPCQKIFRNLTFGFLHIQTIQIKTSQNKMQILETVMKLPFHNYANL